MTMWIEAAENWGPKKSEWNGPGAYALEEPTRLMNNQGVDTRAGPYPYFFQVPGFLGVVSVAQ